ncbi:MAG TPA: hypothetical protein PLF63_09235, partial [Rubrivivax sp.]|nr:hypothetical protein [Rubrivivax sp.]
GHALVKIRAGQREHHRHQFDLLHRYVAEHPECTAFDAMGALFPRLRGAADDVLALGETLAHLAWLREDGVLQRRLADDGTWRHALASTTDDAEIHW